MKKQNKGSKTLSVIKPYVPKDKPKAKPKPTRANVVRG